MALSTKDVEFIALSTKEVEFIALREGLKSAIPLKGLITEL
jgi:hypothetical protein